MDRNEAIRRIKSWNLDRDDMEILAEVVPELKESEDERIRKSLVAYFAKFKPDDMWDADFSFGDIVAWLEKQGEQTPADKVEPKFHEGEWLCENEPNNYARFIQILETVNVQGKERYRISRDIHNNEDVVEFDFVEKYYHKFDIKDAKDGDVLANKYGSVFIYAGFEDDKRVTVDNYCYITAKHDEFCIEDHKTGSWYYVKHLNPATKEQRDLLFQKMKEAGYEWDAEKKELKKIEQKHTPKHRVGDTIYYNSFGELKSMIVANVVIDSTDNPMYEDKEGNAVFEKDIIEQNPTWSEEDEERLNSIIESYKYLLRDYKACHDVDHIPYNSNTVMRTVENDVNFLRTLKDRVQPHLKQEWSEEDEKMLNKCIEYASNIVPVKATKERGMFVDFKRIPDEKTQNWLKALKERYTWKPSKTQIDALESAIDALDAEDDGLVFLCNDLKKLKG